jgi:hypothetical protein
MDFLKKCLNVIIILFLSPIIIEAELPSVNTKIAGNGTRGPYLLGYENIILNSVSVYRNDILLDSGDYDIGYIEGVIWFDDVMPLDDTLVIEFRYLPVSIQNQYYLHELKPRTKRDSSQKSVFKQSSATAETDITISGSKGFSIETGGGSDRISQSLNLNIVGQLIPGLKTSAHISDKSGNGSAVTRRLNELDKIYIKAESRYFMGTFGDFDFQEKGSSMMNFRRKLTGLNLMYSKGDKEFRGAAGFFPGEYRKINLAGVDGRLGPYYLTDINGREGIPVLPGSERVYIDGELLSRGSEKEYTIDYESGTIQFTPSIVMRDESRITIEYEIAREEYSRSFFAAAGDYYSFGGLRIFSKLIQEGDDGDSPKSFDMTSENRGLIENAGSDSLGASKSGVTYKGPGEGDYDLVEDSLGNQYYEYAGPDLGEYDVTFSFVGENRGSYVSLGGGLFQYAGADSGDYESVILLPIPRVRRYGTIGTSWESESKEIILNGEISGSLHDRNTISQNDNIEKGTSGSAEIDFTHNIFGSEAFAGLGIKTRKIGDGMIFPGRVDNIERYRDYDLDPEAPIDGEWMGEVTFRGGLDSERNISILLGDLRRPNDENRKRRKGAFEWRVIDPLKFNGRIERTSGERIWLKRDLGLSAFLGILQPEIGLEYEKRDGVSGFKYYEYDARIPAAISSDLKTVTELNYRDEKALQSSWVDKFQSGYIRQNLEFTLAKTGLSGEFNGSYYRKKFKEVAGADSEQKSGWMRLAYNDPEERLELKLNERLSASNERMQARNFIFVGEGNGEFRFEDGEYIRDPDGDYILVLEELGEGEKITEISTEFFGVIHPFKFSNSGDELEVSIGRLIAESDLAYNQRKSREDLVLKDFVPWKKDNLDDLVFRNGRLDLRLFYYPPFSRHRIKYNMIRSYEDGRRYANEISRDGLSSDEISWAFPAGKKINFVAAGLIAKSKRQINQSDLSLNRHRESVSMEYEFYESWTLRLGAGYENVRQKETDIISHIPSGDYGLTKELGRRGRITATLSYFRVIVRPEGSYIPYQIAGGKREGDNFESGLQARIEPVKNGRLELSYRFEKFSERPERQNLKLDFTLLFL